MHRHHTELIANLVQAIEPDPRYLAIIVGGSIAKQRERPNSDVDVLLVATDDEFARAVAEGKVWYYNSEPAGYPGGYVDGKVINYQFLLDAADHGSEPARSAFTGAFVPYTRIPGLQELIVGIPVYPEAERREKIVAFYSQVMLLRWFLGEAEARQDRALLLWAAVEMSFYGSRLLLAHNRVLYPYRKWLRYEVERVTAKPDDFLARSEALLTQPCTAHADAFVECLEAFHQWDVAMDTAVSRFILDVEWGWRQGRPPLAEW